MAVERRPETVAELAAKHANRAARIKMHRDAMAEVARQAQANIDKQAQSQGSTS